MVFRDQQLSCEKCGKTFFFTVTEQRRMAERQGMDQVDTPTLCMACRSGTAAPPPPVERPPEERASVETSRAERPRTEQPRTEQPRTERPRTERPRTERPRTEEPPAERPPERAPRREPATAQTGGLSIADAFPHEEDGIEVKLIGIVKWFSRAKGYGFITKADGEDLFFHRAEVAASSEGWPEDGQQVEFQIRRTGKGPEAFNVSLLPTD